MDSKMHSLALLSKEERQAFLDSLSDEEAATLYYDWEQWARPKQLPPDWNWFIWLLLSGRGGGKTRSGAELVIKWAKEKTYISEEYQYGKVDFILDFFNITSEDLKEAGA